MKGLFTLYLLNWAVPIHQFEHKYQAVWSTQSVVYKGSDWAQFTLCLCLITTKFRHWKGWRFWVFTLILTGITNAKAAKIAHQYNVGCSETAFGESCQSKWILNKKERTRKKNYNKQRPWNPLIIQAMSDFIRAKFGVGSLSTVSGKSENYKTGSRCDH